MNNITKNGNIHILTVDESKFNFKQPDYIFQK